MIMKKNFTHQLDFVLSKSFASFYDDFEKS